MERLGFKQQMKGALGAIPVCGLITICLEVGLAFLHRGGSIEKHLIHFAILLLAAWGMVLLYGAVPSVRRIWKRIDREILSVEKRKAWVDIVYATFAMLMLLHHFYVLLYYPKLPAGASRFAPVWIPFAVITVLMGKLWRNKGFWIGTILAAYLFERTYIKNPDITGETMVYMVSMIYALIICYGIFSVIRPNLKRAMLRILCSLWTLATLSFCMTGLYFAWTGNVVENLGDGKTELIHVFVNGMMQVRLGIFSNSNITGGIAACGAMVTLIGFAVTKNYISKAFYIIACFLMMVTNALAVTRSCFLMLSFALASIITSGVWGLLKRHFVINGWGNILLVFGMIACLGLCFWGTYTVQQQLGNKFVELRDQDGLIVSSAKAEAEEATQISTPKPDFAERDILSDNINYMEFIKNLFSGQVDEEKLNQITTGRWKIWKTVYEYVKQNPEMIYWGLSADGNVKKIIQPQPHCHNILIQMFLEGGIPGIVMYLGLFGYFLFHACCLWRRWDLPLWKRSLPILVLAVMLMEMVDCLTHFAYGHVPMTVLYFFMGATIAVSRSLEKKEKQEGSSTLPGMALEQAT